VVRGAVAVVEQPDGVTELAFETPSEESAGRPLRRYYQLTDKGRELAEKTLAARGAARRVTRRALALASVQ
jgi:DNA-binding PadR family transcriptional regulator